MGKAANEALDELASRMSAYRERATAARRLARAITDQHAIAGLIEHAQEFEKRAEEIAAQIVSLAETDCDDARQDSDDDASSAAALSASPARHRD